MTSRAILGAAGCLVTVGFLTTGVLAHHGWTWTEEKQTEMTGKITKIYIGPPHPQINIDTADGPWTIDFGNPNQTLAAGFVEGSAKVGDTVLILGNRSNRPGEKLMKAVRATINGKAYTFYPERLPKPAGN